MTECAPNGLSRSEENFFKHLAEHIKRLQAATPQQGYQLSLKLLSLKEELLFIKQNPTLSIPKKKEMIDALKQEALYCSDTLWENYANIKDRHIKADIASCQKQFIIFLSFESPTLALQQIRAQAQSAVKRLLQADSHLIQALDQPLNSPIETTVVPTIEDEKQWGFQVDIRKHPELHVIPLSFITLNDLPAKPKRFQWWARFRTSFFRDHFKFLVRINKSLKGLEIECDVLSELQRQLDINARRFKKPWFFFSRKTRQLLFGWQAQLLQFQWQLLLKEMDTLKQAIDSLQRSQACPSQKIQAIKQLNKTLVQLTHGLTRLSKRYLKHEKPLGKRGFHLETQEKLNHLAKQKKVLFHVEKHSNHLYQRLKQHQPSVNPDNTLQLDRKAILDDLCQGNVLDKDLFTYFQTQLSIYTLLEKRSFAREHHNQLKALVKETAKKTKAPSFLEQACQLFITLGEENLLSDLKAALENRLLFTSNASEIKQLEASLQAIGLLKHEVVFALNAVKKAVGDSIITISADLRAHYQQLPTPWPTRLQDWPDALIHTGFTSMTQFRKEMSDHQLLTQQLKKHPRKIEAIDGLLKTFFQAHKNLRALGAVQETLQKNMARVQRIPTQYLLNLTSKHHLDFHRIFPRTFNKKTLNQQENTHARNHP